MSSEPPQSSTTIPGFDLTNPLTWSAGSTTSNIQHSLPPQHSVPTAIPHSIRHAHPTLSFTTPVMPHPSTMDLNLINGLHSHYPAPRLGQELYQGNFVEHLTMLMEWVRDPSLGGQLSPHITFGTPLSNEGNQSGHPQISLLLDQDGNPSTHNLGVFANATIPPHQPLITITSNHIIFPTGVSPKGDFPIARSLSRAGTEPNDTKDRPLNTNGPQFQALINAFSRIAPPQLDHIHIALRLFLERCLGESFYSPALAVLPANYPTMDFLNPSTIYLDPQISPPQLRTHIKFIQQHFYQMVNAIFTQPPLSSSPHQHPNRNQSKTLYEQLIDLFPSITTSTTPLYHNYSPNFFKDSDPLSQDNTVPNPNTPSPKDWVLDKLIWAYYTSVSRCFGSPPQSTQRQSQPPQTCFIPMIDLLNNDTENPNCYITFATTVTPSPKPTQSKTKTKTKQTSPNQKPQQPNPVGSKVELKPQFIVTLMSGPEGIKAAEELTFSYTTQDNFNPITLPTITGQYSELIAQLREINDIEDLFTISLLRTPHNYINRWLHGGKDVSHYFIFYGMAQKLHYEESIFIHNLDLSVLFEFTPSYACFVNDFQSIQAKEGASVQCSLADAPIKFILPGHNASPDLKTRHSTYSSPRHDAIIQSVLAYPDLRSVMTWDWTGPSSPLMALCRALAVGTFDSVLFQSKLGSSIPSTHDESRKLTCEQMERCAEAMCDLVEKRICNAYIPQSKIQVHINNALLLDPLCDLSIDIDVKPPKTNNLKGGRTTGLSTPHNLAPFNPEHYILAFSDPIDQVNEYGAMIIAYSLLINQATTILSQPHAAMSTTTTTPPKTLRSIITDFYTALSNRDFFTATAKYLEYSKSSLIAHSLVVLATRLGLDMADPTARPSWFQEHWLLFHEPHDQVPNVANQTKADRMGRREEKV